MQHSFHVTAITRKNKQLSGEILSGRNVIVTSEDEDYYGFELAGSPGAPASNLPRVWIDPHSSDRQVKEKLSAEFRRAFDPNSEPDDLSIPGLRDEGRQIKA